MLQAIKAKLIIDGTGAEPIRDGVLLIEDDEIVKVGPQARVEIPDAARVTDVGDQTLLPGLVDPHSHVTIFPGRGQPGHQVQAPPGMQLLRGAGHMRIDLLAGTTTMRILGENNNADFLMREAIDQGIVPGPRLFVSGKAVRPSHGHGFMGTPADGADGVRTTIRENCHAGADQIKIFVSGGISDHHTDLGYSYYSKEEIHVALDEALRVGKAVAIHCKGGPGLRWAVEAGATTVEHGYLATDDDLELMQQKGAWLGATLVNVYHELGNSPEIMKDPYRGAKARHAIE
ncbi:MAG: amidohydrolase family protein, partial [Chloroflexota bacterium]